MEVAIRVSHWGGLEAEYVYPSIYPYNDPRIHRTVQHGFGGMVSVFTSEGLWIRRAVGLVHPHAAGRKAQGRPSIAPRQTGGPLRCIMDQQLFSTGSKAIRLTRDLSMVRLSVLS